MVTASIFFITSALSVNLRPRGSGSCDARVTPTMVDTKQLFYSTPCKRDDGHPASSAITLNRAVDASDFSLMNRFTITA